MDERVGVAEVNAMGPAAAGTLLRPACASDTWVDAVVAGRPYDTLASLEAHSEAVIGELSWTDVEQALGAHPRIGERSGGTDVESSWSRDEQSAAADGQAVDALARGNAEYERRFGHVFLICATGKSSGQVLDALRARLDNDAVAEQHVVRRELAAIARLRLGRIVR